MSAQERTTTRPHTGEPQTLPGGLVLRPYEEGDEHAILESFNRVFCEIDPSMEPRRLDEWRWRFLENPAGYRIWVAATEDGQIAAQQAGIPIRVRIDGRNVLWNHVIDSFSDKQFGQGLKKPGLFVTLVDAYNRAIGGAERGQALAMIGMPVRSAYRIGRRFLNYRPVRNQLQLRAPVGRIDAAPAVNVVVTERVDFPDEVEELFLRVSRHHKMVAVRDRAFLDWRFVRRPRNAYRIATARIAGRLVGYAVFHASAFDQEPAGLAADWLVDPAFEEVRAPLVAWLAACTREAGLDEVCFVLPDSCQEFRELQELGFRARPSSYVTTAGSFTDRFHTTRMHAGWYHTLAEFDLC